MSPWCKTAFTGVVAPFKELRGQLPLVELVEARLGGLYVQLVLSRYLPIKPVSCVTVADRVP